MRKKKSKFFTFIFSTMFGAGQMYMGFMKQGISLMTTTALIISIGVWFEAGPIMFALPILWFYSFFDSINKRYLSDEEFDQLDDYYLFPLNADDFPIKQIVTRYNLVIAILFILVGSSILGDYILDFLASQVSLYYSPALYGFINSLRWNIPRMLFAIMIIGIGVKMILGKKKELSTEVETNENS